MGKISFISAALVAMTASVSQATVLNRNVLFENYLQQSTPATPANYMDQAHLQYYFACVNGYMSGYLEGFYANASETVGAQCLGQSTLTSMENFITDATSGNLQQIFQSFNVFYQAVYLVQTQCRFQEVTQQIMMNCLNVSNNCSATTITNNLVSNLFHITGALNYIASDIVTEVSNFQSIDVTKISQGKATFQNLGLQLG